MANEMTAFATDEHLMYRRPDVEYQHQPGRDLVLSEAYRTAQLPLVNPTHPDVIQSDNASGYDWMGTYAAPRISLVGFVGFHFLSNSPDFNACMNELTLSAASSKVAWSMIDTRRYRHHFTVCGRLNAKMPDAEVVPFVRERLRSVRRFWVRALGPWFAQDKNGRGYLPIYPELGPGSVDALSKVQRALDVGGPNGFFLGCLQLRDHLRFSDRFDTHEADDWFEILRRWRHRTMCEIEVEELALIQTHDDLLLNARVLERFRLL